MKLSAYLKEVGLTYRQFADIIGMNNKGAPVTLSRYSKGARSPRKERAKAIVEATGGKVTINDLYG